MKRRLLPLFAISYSLFFSTACNRTPPAMTVFYAAAFEPVMHDLLPRAEKSLGRPVTAETGGSGNLMRKVTELGRSCDLVMLTDGSYFKARGAGRFAWRLDFASDSLVLAVGARAPKADAAERDWVPVLLDPAVRLGRADEGISPAGARALRLLKALDAASPKGLEARLREPGVLVVDDVGTLAARLKAGDLDYAFLYRTTCLMQDIRFIPLKGEPDPALYSLSIPDNAPNPEAAVILVRTLLTTWRDVWEEKGFVMIKPAFFGDRASYSLFRDIADYGGPLE
jgi:ABC-type molybdate transport system substrate-binding protein